MHLTNVIILCTLKYYTHGSEEQSLSFLSLVQVNIWMGGGGENALCQAFTWSWKNIRFVGQKYWIVWLGLLHPRSLWWWRYPQVELPSQDTLHNLENLNGFMTQEGIGKCRRRSAESTYMHHIIHLILKL